MTITKTPSYIEGLEAAQQSRDAIAEHVENLGVQIGAALLAGRDASALQRSRQDARSELEVADDFVRELEPLALREEQKLLRAAGAAALKKHQEHELKIQAAIAEAEAATAHADELCLVVAKLKNQGSGLYQASLDLQRHIDAYGDLSTQESIR